MLARWPASSTFQCYLTVKSSFTVYQSCRIGGLHQHTSYCLTMLYNNHNAVIHSLSVIPTPWPATVYIVLHFLSFTQQHCCIQCNILQVRDASSVACNMTQVIHLHHLCVEGKAGVCICQAVWALRQLAHIPGASCKFAAGMIRANTTHHSSVMFFSFQKTEKGVWSRLGAFLHADKFWQRLSIAASFFDAMYMTDLMVACLGSVLEDRVGGSCLGGFSWGSCQGCCRWITCRDHLAEEAHLAGFIQCTQLEGAACKAGVSCAYACCRHNLGSRQDLVCTAMHFFSAVVHGFIAAGCRPAHITSCCRNIKGVT